MIEGYEFICIREPKWEKGTHFGGPSHIKRKYPDGCIDVTFVVAIPVKFKGEEVIGLLVPDFGRIEPAEA